MGQATGGRNIVVFCDGTWNSPEEERFGLPTATNVYKLYRASLDEAESDGRQIVWYQPGVGVLGGALNRLVEGATGTGVSRGIQRGYAAIAALYRGPEDRIFLVGFSRGAFTARSIAGMVDCVGLVKSPTARQLKKAYAHYRAQKTLPAAEAHLGVRVHAIGVWETVAALGLAIWGRSYNLRLIFRNEFHRLSPTRAVNHVFHALALDEKRTSFMPERWPKGDSQGPEVEECWFRGVHSDVGGGYGDCGLSDIALDWMATRLEGAGLLLRKPAPVVQPDPGGRIHNSYRGPLWTSVASWPRWAPLQTLKEGASARECLHESVAQREILKRRQGSDERARLRLAPGQSTKVSVAADHLWVYSGIVLEPGGRYRVTAGGRWQDAGDAPVGPLGQEPSTESWIKRLARGRRRHPSARWMALVALANEPIDIPATVGSLLAALKHWLIADPPWFITRLRALTTGVGMVIEPRTESMLWLFANDYFRTYGNNSGSVTVTVERIDVRESDNGLVSPGHMLLMDAIQPGDVLLVRGGGAQSRLIASLSGGPYSHAGLFLSSDRLSEPVLHESDREGVGATPLPMASVRLRSSPELRMVLILGRLEQAILLRHPRIDEVSDERLAKAYLHVRNTKLHQHYPELGRLAAPAGLPQVVEEFLTSTQQLADRVAQRRVRRGVFCSELVGSYFDQIKLPLVEGGHVSARLAPNHLQPGASLLQPVPDALIDAARFAEDVVELTEAVHPIWTRKQSVPMLVEQTTVAWHVQRSVREASNLVRHMSDAVHSRSQAEARKQMASLESFVRGLLVVGDVARAERCALLMELVRWSILAEQEAHELIHCDLDDLGVSLKDYESVVVAASRRVTGLVHLVRLEVSRAELRHNLVWQAEYRRKNPPTGVIERWRERRRRAEAARMWRLSQVAWSSSTETIRQEFGKPVGKRAQELVDHVHSQAENRLSDEAYSDTFA